MFTSNSALFVIAGLGVLLGVGVTAPAEPPAQADPGQKPNVSAAGVALEGYSPVSYFEAGKAEMGKAEYAVNHDGATYHFASAAQRETFRANPGKYLPAYNGWCAFGMAIEKTFPIDPKRFKIVDGRLLLFLKNEKVDALELWNK